MMKGLTIQKDCDGDCLSCVAETYILCRKRINPTNTSAPMDLPEEMPFTPDEIPQKKFVVVDSELRQFFDAWMYSTKDVRILTRLNSAIRGRIISIGGASGVTCARCHTYKSSGYYLCEGCYYKNEIEIYNNAIQTALLLEKPNFGHSLEESGWNAAMSKIKLLLRKAE